MSNVKVVLDILVYCVMVQFIDPNILRWFEVIINSHIHTQTDSHACMNTLRLL